MFSTYWTIFAVTFCAINPINSSKISFGQVTCWAIPFVFPYLFLCSSIKGSNFARNSINIRKLPLQVDPIFFLHVPEVPIYMELNYFSNYFFKPEAVKSNQYKYSQKHCPSPPNLKHIPYRSLSVSWPSIRQTMFFQSLNPSWLGKLSITTNLISITDSLLKDIIIIYESPLKRYSLGIWKLEFGS